MNRSDRFSVVVAVVSVSTMCMERNYRFEHQDAGGSKVELLS